MTGTRFVDLQAMLNDDSTASRDNRWEVEFSDDASISTDGELERYPSETNRLSPVEDDEHAEEPVTLGPQVWIKSNHQYHAVILPGPLSERSSLPFRLACSLMSIFFCYAARVQLNDPDWYFWLSLYGGACLTSVLHAGALCPLFSRQVAQLLLAVSSLLLVESLRARVQEEGYAFLWTPSAMLDLATEAGREQVGILLVGFWSAVLAVPSWGGQNGRTRLKGLREHVFGFFLLLLAGVVLACIWIVPMYFMDAIRVSEENHCYGLGISPDSISDTANEL